MGTPDRAQMQQVGPLKMEAGAGSLKDYKNMGQAWTCGVKRETTKGFKVCLKVYWQKKEGKKKHVSPLSSEQWRSGQEHKNLNAFLS